MTTANQLIAQSLGLLGVKDPIENVGGTEAASALIRLNTLVDWLRINSLYTKYLQRVTYSLSTATATIGPAANFAVSVRPERIELGSFFSSGGVDYPITPISAQDYDRIPVKTNGAIGPDCVYLDRQTPTSTLYFYPVPASAVTVTLLVQNHLASFADLTTSYTLAPGVERALMFTLAEELAADYEREIPPTVARNAASARRALKRANAVVPTMQLDPSIPVGGRFWSYWG